MALADKFLRYCDNEYANREDNAENCADAAREVALDFVMYIQRVKDEPWARGLNASELFYQFTQSL